ncbi:cation transporter, partial [Escherichia coli]
MTRIGAIDPAGEAVESRFIVEGMHCAGCIARIEGALAKLDGVVMARVNFGA